MPRPKNLPEHLDRRLPTQLSRGTSTGKGQQLRDMLVELIDSLPPGALLPGERVLAERYGLARMTVRQQVEALVAAGRLTRVPGRGTFVTEPKFVQTEQMSSFSRDMLARGMTPGSRLLSRRVVPADLETAARLEIADGDPVVHIVRIRLADDEPMAVERTNLPCHRFPGLESLPMADTSLYGLLSAHYGCQPTSAEQRISAVAVEAADARRLGVPARSPAFLIERVARDNMGHVVEFGRSLYRGDRYDVLMHVGIERRRDVGAGGSPR